MAFMQTKLENGSAEAERREPAAKAQKPIRGRFGCTKGGEGKRKKRLTKNFCHCN